MTTSYIIFFNKVNVFFISSISSFLPHIDSKVIFNTSITIHVFTPWLECKFNSLDLYSLLYCITTSYFIFFNKFNMFFISSIFFLFTPYRLKVIFSTSITIHVSRQGLECKFNLLDLYSLRLFFTINYFIFFNKVNVFFISSIFFLFTPYRLKVIFNHFHYHT